MQPLQYHGKYVSWPVQISITGVVFDVKTVTLLWQPQQKFRTLQESVTPVQSFAAETYFIPIMITKEPQLVSETNIPLLIPGWWQLCTDMRTAYACVCGNNESVHV